MGLVRGVLNTGCEAGLLLDVSWGNLCYADILVIGSTLTSSLQDRYAQGCAVFIRIRTDSKFCFNATQHHICSKTNTYI